MSNPSEIITADPKTLSDSYLLGVRQRLLDGTGSPADRLYAAEAQRRPAEKRRARFAKFEASWPRGSFAAARRQFVPDAIAELSDDGVETSYLDLETGFGIKYDNENRYFRIRDTAGGGYLDADGSPLNT